MSTAPNVTPNVTPVVRGIDYNEADLVIGPPQYGKTTVMRASVKAHLETHKTGIALVHDPNRQFRDLCALYENVAEWRKALDVATKSGAAFPRGASIGGSWAELRAAAVELGRARNSAGNVRMPIRLVADESSMMEDSGSSHAAKEEVMMLSNRRHLGIGPAYNAQRATALTDAFFAMATRVVVFAQPSEKETTKLEERLGLRPGTLDCLIGAPPFTFVDWRAGKGIV